MLNMVKLESQKSCTFPIVTLFLLLFVFVVLRCQRQKLELSGGSWVFQDYIPPQRPGVSIKHRKTAEALSENP